MVDVIVDGQWGSTGKGLVSEYLGRTRDYKVVVSNNTRNASHTAYIRLKGKLVPYKFVSLPVAGVINKNSKIVISGDASIDLNQLFKELDDLSEYGIKGRLYIHPCAVIITDKDISEERKSIKHIASTMTGTGSAKAKKIMRNNYTIARDIQELAGFVCDVYEVIHEVIRDNYGNSHICLVEGSQGFDLSIDHGGVFGNNLGWYPYTTSRNVDPSSLLGMCGISPRLIGDVIGVIRTYPIRVGDASNNRNIDALGNDISGSSSGGYYDDQRELSWKHITERSGSPEEIVEYTSLTGRVRRVFSFSRKQFMHFSRVCMPTSIVINFANYLDYRVYGLDGKISIQELKDKYSSVYEFINMVLDSQWYNTIRDVYIGTSEKTIAKVVD